MNEAISSVHERLSNLRTRVDPFELPEEVTPETPPRPVWKKLAALAHGIIVEVHDEPEVAQALRLPRWLELGKERCGAVVEPW